MNTTAAAAAAAAGPAASAVPGGASLPLPPKVRDIYESTNTAARFPKRLLGEILPEGHVMRDQVFELDATDSGTILTTLKTVCTIFSQFDLLPQLGTLVDQIAQCAKEDTPFFQLTRCNIGDNGNLRDIQRQNIQEMTEIWSDPRRGANARLLCEVCTGGGKSGIIAMAPYAAGAKRVLIVTPSPKIHEQLINDVDATKDTSFLKMRGVLPRGAPGNEVKVLDANRKIAEENLGDQQLVDAMKRNHITVITQDLLVAGRRPPNPPIDAATNGATAPAGPPPKTIDQFHRAEAIARCPDTLFDLIIIDEAHHQPAATWKNMLTILPPAKQLLLTATPFRTDGQTPDSDYKLTPFRLLDAVEADPPVAKTTTFLEVTPNVQYEREFDASEDVPFWDDKVLCETSIKDVAMTTVAILLKKRKLNQVPHRAIVCAPTIKKCELIANIFNDLQVPIRPGGRMMVAKVLKGKSGKSDDNKRRSATLKGLETHDISDISAVDIVIQCHTLGEGYDNPLLSVGVMLSHTKSLSYFAQAFAGRPARKLDHENNGLSPAQNREEHGFDKDANNVSHLITHWALDQRRIWDQFCGKQQPGMAPSSDDLQSAELDAELQQLAAHALTQMPADDGQIPRGGAAAAVAASVATASGVDDEAMAGAPSDSGARGTKRSLDTSASAEVGYELNYYIKRDVLHRTPEHKQKVIACDNKYLTPNEKLMCPNNKAAKVLDVGHPRTPPNLS